MANLVMYRTGLGMVGGSLLRNKKGMRARADHHSFPSSPSLFLPPFSSSGLTFQEVGSSLVHLALHLLYIPFVRMLTLFRWVFDLRRPMTFTCPRSVCTGLPPFNTRAQLTYHVKVEHQVEVVLTGGIRGELFLFSYRSFSL